MLEHRPDVLKAYRNRCENALDVLSKQTSPSTLLQMDVFLGRPTGAREHALVAMAFGVTEAQVLLRDVGCDGALHGCDRGRPRSLGRRLITGFRTCGVCRRAWLPRERAEEQMCAATRGRACRRFPSGGRDRPGTAAEADDTGQVPPMAGPSIHERRPERGRR